MEPSADHPDRIRRVVLPSGRTIDIVLVVAEDAAPTRATPEAPECCPACTSMLVQPQGWEEADDGRWSVSLVCPDCWHEDEVLLDQDGVDRYDEVLDEGARAVACDLDRLARANREEAVRRFAAALDDGLIRPEDF